MNTFLGPIYDQVYAPLDRDVLRQCCRMQQKPGNHRAPRCQSRSIVLKSYTKGRSYNSRELDKVDGIELTSPYGHVEDFMKTSGLITAKPDDNVSKLMDQPYTGFPVVDDDNVVVGVISEKDIIRAVKEAGASARVGDYMTSPAFTVQGRAHVAEAAGVMLAGKVHRLPIVDRDGKLVGLVSRTDIFKPLLEPRKDLYDFILRRRDVFSGLD